MWVYPRVCGEARLYLSYGLRSRSSGLSPRVRGSLGPAKTTAIAVGSIPACAGKPRPECASSADYPGGSIPACAGKPSAPRRPLRCSGMGLSPRVRGSLGRQPRPARDRRCRVYPRVCGEANLIPVDHRDRGPGLSPRVRGSHVVGVDSAQSTGSIPACAGKPVHAGLLGRQCWRNGSIPACAGKPILRVIEAPGHRRRVYPRVCGEAFQWM